ncbi:MAG: hypothetical protein LBR60_06895 [Fibrobacter sp.]|nr:hypothetical protein [Fibrobacter sp.]
MFAFLLFLADVAVAQESRFARFTDSFRVSDDSLAVFRVDSLEFYIGDVFDDSRFYTRLDSTIYSIMNSIHIETRQSVVSDLLLFNRGDSVNLYQLIESERFLRDQSYISDAKILYVKGAHGENILRVYTSDNWTLTLPVSLERPGEEWYYGIGIQENNFLGMGQTLGVYYGHNEFRDMFSVRYENPHFLFRYNHLFAFFSENTDGYQRFIQMNLPYLTRMKNQWAYTVDGLMQEQDEIYYWSGKLPPGARRISAPAEGPDFVYGNKNSNAVMKVIGMREDSASFRLSRSFGTSDFKLYFGAGYHFHQLGKDYSDVLLRTFRNKENVYQIEEDYLNDWIPSYRDSRFGLSLTLSRIRYDRLRNFRHAKWTEDVDKGYTFKLGLSRNAEWLQADNNDFRLDYSVYLALGSKEHHLTLETSSYFYFNEDTRHRIYEKITGEYIWHSNDFFSTVLSGTIDTYKSAPYGEQLSLGGLEGEGLYGLPSSLYSGQARFLFGLEERFFPNIEIGTVVPVFVVFGRAGETQDKISHFEPRDLLYIAGVGVRLSMTKSVTGLVNHVSLSWPLNGPLKDPMPRFSVVGLISL